MRRLYGPVVLPAAALATLSLAAAQDAPREQGAPREQVVTRYEAAMIAAPPKPLKLDPFYRKHADAYGIPIVSSEKVADTALLLARDIVNYMLVKRPDIRAELVRQGSRVMVMAESEQQMDLPEYRNWTKPAKDDRRLTPRERDNYDGPGGIGSLTAQQYWNRRARGMGGIRTSCAEENLLGRPDTRYFGEHICVHEFSHGIMSAIRTADPPLFEAIQAANAQAKEKGLFKGHYAENTAAEYWAEGTQWWFWSNFPWNTPEGVELWSPDDLKTYDPALYDILARVYLDHHIPADVYHGRKLRSARR